MTHPNKQDREKMVCTCGENDACSSCPKSEFSLSDKLDGAVWGVAFPADLPPEELWQAVDGIKIVWNKIKPEIESVLSQALSKRTSEIVEMIKEATVCGCGREDCEDVPILEVIKEIKKHYEN